MEIYYPNFFFCCCFFHIPVLNQRESLPSFFVNTTSNSSGVISLNQTAFLDDLNASGDMLALWHFDGNLDDSSGRANHLTNVNNVSSNTTAKFGTSYYFMGFLTMGSWKTESNSLPNPIKSHE